MDGLSFDSLRVLWILVCAVLCVATVLCLSSRFRSAGMVLAVLAWMTVFTAAGFRFESLNSDTESYVGYAQDAADSSLGEYLLAVRLEPGWAAMVHSFAAVVPDARWVLLLCSLATMFLLLFPLRSIGNLAPLGMLHYLFEFYFNNDLAVTRHSFATALSLAIATGLQRKLDAGRTWGARLHTGLLLLPPFFHIASIGMLPARIGGQGSALRIAVKALAIAIGAAVVLRLFGSAFLPERVLEFDSENTREIRGYVHLALLLIVVIVNAPGVRATLERHRIVGFCYLLGVGMSLAVIGFPMLARVRQVLLEFGILFYPLILHETVKPAKFWTTLCTYFAAIASIGIYTAMTLTEKYDEGFF